MKEHRSVVMWIAGILICSFGVALISKADFGMGVIQGPAYAVYKKLSEIYPRLTFGICSYLAEAAFLVLLCVIIRGFRPKYLLSFMTAVLFGLVLDMWRAIIGIEPSDSITLRVIQMACGIVSVSFAVACYFRTDMPLEIWELFVSEFSGHFGFDTAAVKWGFDICMLILGEALCLLFFGKFRFDIIGTGTIVTAFVSGPLIAFFGKLLDRI